MDTYVGDLISQQRNDTRNADDTDSISNADFLRYNQYAQDRLFSLITRNHPWVFVETIDISIVAGTTTYSINDNLSFGTRIIQVEYSADGTEAAFRRLPPVATRYNRATQTGKPSAYRRKDGQIQVEPTPESSVGTLRVTYERALDRLALRVGQVNGNPSGAVIDLTHSGFGAPSTADEALLVANQYVCISDYYGTPMLYNGVISSYNAGLDELTLAADVDTYLETGYALSDLADGYLTIGKWTTTHSKLNNICERYFNEYSNRRIMARDSSADEREIDKYLKEIESDIVMGYANVDKDMKRIPIHDFNMMIPGYE